MLIFKNSLENISRKNYRNHLKRNDFEVWTAVAGSFLNILENVNLSSDKIRRPPLWSEETEFDFCHQPPTNAVSSEYFNHTLISYVHWI
jgi:hypothetical protein